jgi:RNA polymerase sigma factor (sigma-70 family)
MGKGSIERPAAQDFSSLLSRARAGDAEAVAALYERHAGRVMAIVRRRLSPLLRVKYDTMDLAQSVFVEVLRELPKFEDRGESAFANLLAVKAENKVRLKLRRHVGPGGRRREDRLGSEVRELPDATDVVAAASSRDEDAKLARVLSELDATSRSIMRLHSEGVSFEQIAAALGLPGADAARKRHARALTAARRRWKAAGDAPWR